MRCPATDLSATAELIAGKEAVVTDDAENEGRREETNAVSGHSTYWAKW